MRQRFSKFLKSIILPLVMIGGLFVLLSPVFSAHALTSTDLGLNSNVQQSLGLAATDIRVVIAKIIRAALALLGIVAVGLIIYGGFIYMTSAGEEQKISQGKKIIINGAIGLAIILSSYAITSFVLNKLVEATGGGSTGGGPGGGCTGPSCPFNFDQFYVTALPPNNLKYCVQNVKPAIVFNQNVVLASISGNIVVKEKAAPNTVVTGAWDFGPNHETVVFTPDGVCSSGTINDCLKANTDYILEFSNPGNIKAESNPALTLQCALVGVGCGPINFTSGDTVDRLPPTITINSPAKGSTFEIGSTQSFSLTYNDDSGVQNVTLSAANPQGGQSQIIGSVASTACKKTDTVTIPWNTFGYNPADYVVTANALDFAGQSGQDSGTYTLRPSHCFNGVQDVDETGIDCGGTTCGVCAGGTCTSNNQCASGVCQNGVCINQMSITGFSPSSGAPGTFVSIFGNYFGNTPGKVYFAKVANPVSSSPSDWIQTTPPPSCGPSFDYWNTNQIIVQAPTGTVASTPIKVVSAFQPSNLQPGLVGWWSFDSSDVSGKTVTDLSGKGNDGTISDSTSLVDGIVDKAIQFDGVSGKVTTKFGQDLNKPFTWSAWIKVSDTSNFNSIMNQGNGINHGLNLAITPSNYWWGGPLPHFEVQSYPGLGILDQAVAPNTWYNVALVRNTSTANNIFLYVNGQRTNAQGNLSLTGTDNTSPIIIGEYVYGSGNVYGMPNKVIDDVSIYDRALSDSEILSLYNREYQRAVSADSFSVNSTIHPGICSLTPTNGAPGDSVSVSGNNFGSLGSASDGVFFGTEKAATASWADTLISAAVPGIFSGDLAVKVVKNNVESNKVKFTVNPIDTGTYPIITSVSPQNGPSGQYITITGKNFGINLGKILFKQTLNGALLYGAFNFPTACTNVWSDTQVIVKAPSGLQSGVTYTVQVQTSDAVPKTSLYDQNQFFAGADGTPSPGICNISPAEGPIPLPNGGRVDIFGEYFIVGSSKVYYWGANATSPDSINGRVEATIDSNFSTVSYLSSTPAVGTVTGPVTVYRTNDSKMSNPVNFNVADCTAAGNTCASGYQCCTSGGDKGTCILGSYVCAGTTRFTGYVWRFSTKDIPKNPAVVERCDAVTESGKALPTPSPSTQWDAPTGDSYNVCKSALVTVEFSTPLLQSSVDASSVKVNQCASISGDVCNSPTPVNLDSASLTLSTAFGSGTETHQSLELKATVPWAAGQWYQVVLGSGIRSLSADPVLPLLATKPCGAGTAYCFAFKASGQDCALRAVIVTPYSYWTDLLAAPMMKQTTINATEPVVYEGNGLSTQRCIIMDMGGFSWNWFSGNTSYADIFGDKTKRNVEVSSLANTVGIGLTDNSVLIEAKASTSTLTKTGTSPLSVDLSDPKVTDWWPKCDLVCSNAAVGVKFNVTLSTKNISTNPDTIRLLKCLDENCFTTLDVTDSAALDSSNPNIINIANNGSGPAALLNDTTYEVTVSNKTASPLTALNNIWARATLSDPASFGKPYNDQFAWRFHTKKDTCAVSRVEVKPAKYVASSITDRAVFNAQPYSAPDSCSAGGEKLNPWELNWSWSSSSTSVATIASYSTKGYNPVCAGNCILRGSTIPSSLKPIPTGICGNGVVEAGEDCDGPGVGCGLDCRFLGTPSNPVNNGLMAYYNFNKCDAKDESGNGYNGTITSPSCVDSATGQGKAYSFNGTSDHITIPKNNGQLDITGDVTVSAWVKVNKFNTGGCVYNQIISGRSVEVSMPYNLAIDGSDICTNFQTNATWVSRGVGATIPVGQWVQVSMVRSSTQIYFYLNGSSKGSAQSFSGTVLGSGTDKLIGEGFYGGPNYFNGLIDSVRIYNRALSDAEIQTLYTDSSLNGGICGNGIVDPGEACDPKDPATSIGCSSNCLHLGSSQSAGSLSTTSSICGNGTIGSGEDCDFGIAPDYSNTKSALDCSSVCLHLGTRISSQWCFDHGKYGTKDFGGFTEAAFSTACANSISRCGDGIAEPEEDSGCDTGNVTPGTHAAFCNDNCLYNDVSKQKCVPNSEGCDKNGQYLGSSLTYSVPSVCGDSNTGIGEDPTCETNLISSSSNLFTDPWALAVGVGQGTGTGTPPEQSTDIGAKTTNNGADFSGTGKFTIPCGYTKDSDCQAGYGVGSDTCCYARPIITAYTPPTNQSGVCLNTAIAADFNGVINQASLTTSSVIIARGELTKCGPGEKDVTAIALRTGTNKNAPWYIRIVDSIRNLFAWLFGYEARASFVPDVWCAGADAGEVTVQNTGANVSRIVITLKNILAADNPYKIILTDKIKDTRGVSISGSGLPLVSPFSTGSTLCEVNSVTVTPASWYFSTANANATLTARAFSTNGEISSIPGVYEWSYQWEPVNSPFVTVQSISASTANVTSKNQNGEVDARALANVTTNLVGAAKGVVASGSSHITVFLCENPWPIKMSSSISVFPYSDSPLNHDGFSIANGVFDGSVIPPSDSGVGNGYFNFSTYYCADAGSHGTLDDRPYLRPVVQYDSSTLKIAHGSCEATGDVCDKDSDCSLASNLLNGSFEDQTAWQTNAASNQITYLPSPTNDGQNNPVNAEDGSQFVKLDATSVYQDIATTPGTTLHWQFFHRGYNGLEKMQIAIGAPGSTLTNQTLNGILDDVGVWNKHEGDYLVPAGQYQTRISLDSNVVGNLVDNVSLTVAPLTCFINSPIKRFLFTNDRNSDAIGIQIFRNPKHLSPMEWYSSGRSTGGQGFQGTVQTTNIAGYAAVTDGNNIYVGGLNYSPNPADPTKNNLYDVIYLFSVDTTASADTKSVFEDLIKNLHFNTNLTYNDGYCGATINTPGVTTKCISDLDCTTAEPICVAQIAKLQRDYQRITDLKSVDVSLQSYKIQNNAYPKLTAGSYIPGQTVSVWPSWSTFGSVVGAAFPTDPVNKLGKKGTCTFQESRLCSTDSDCAAGDTCLLHDPTTGWSIANARDSFACASSSLAYRYLYDPATGYNVSSHFEDPGVNIDNLTNFVKGFDFSDLTLYPGITAWKADPNSNGICDAAVVTANSGVCGDTIINWTDGERCESTVASPPGTFTPQVKYDKSNCASTGNATVTTCDNFCHWGTPKTVTCASLSICGQNGIEYGETCDDGSLNGTYNHCAATTVSYKGCQGLVPPYQVSNPNYSPGYCGDNVVNPTPAINSAATPELCDPGAIGIAKYGATQAQSCSADCKNYGSYCGDKVIDLGHEACDDGNDPNNLKIGGLNGYNGNVCSPNGAPCTYCSTQCAIVTVQPPTCSYTYTAWGACQPDGSGGGVQTRTYSNPTPTGCVGTPVTSQSCTPCTYTYSYGTCTYNNTDGTWSQSLTVQSASPAGCSGTPLTSQPCQAPTCNYTYSYGTCTYTGSGTAWNQTVTLTGTSPTGCVGTPLTSPQPCPVPACTYTTGAWSACAAPGGQTRTVMASPIGCDSTGTTPPPSQQTCCGDGTAQNPNGAGVSEACDLGAGNNIGTCTASYGNTCVACSSDCITKTTVSGGSCGDGIVQTPNEDCEGSATQSCTVNGLVGVQTCNSCKWSTCGPKPVSLTDDGLLTTTGAATGGGFGNGANSQTAVSGVGSAASVKLAVAATVPVNAFDTVIPAVPKAVAYGTMIRNGADDDIYVLPGSNGTSFYKYSISASSWKTLTNVPSAVYQGSIMIRNGAEGVIYVLAGNSSNKFYKYSISGNSWIALATVPGSSVSYGSAMIRNGTDDDIYVLPGNNTSAFYKYSIAADSWTTLTNVPGTVYSGSTMIRNGSDDNIYVLPGNSSNKFYKYSVSADSWTTLTNVPSAVYQGSTMIRNGADNDIYVLSGNSANFYKYSISGNSWTTLTNAPSTIYGGIMIRNGADDAIYVPAGAGIGFYKYSISGNSWTTLTNAPGPIIGWGGVMIRNGADNDVYVLPNENDTNFYKYSISGNSWIGSKTNNIPPAPGAISWGSAMVRNGADDNIYVLQGNYSTGFYRYSISGNSWTLLATVPGSVNAGSAMIIDGANNVIYVLRGSTTNNFYKYSISSNSWTTLTSVPGVVAAGGTMIRNGTDDDIYILQGNNATGFYKYSISGNSWTSLSVVPGAAGYGGTMIRNGADNDIYVLQGNGTGNFYKYSISGNSWTTLATMQGGGVSWGSALIRNGSDNDIYGLQGSATGFYKYSISGNTWTALTVVPGYVAVGGAIIRNGSDNDIYVLQSNGSINFYKYSISGNSWTTLSAVPDYVSTGGYMIRNGGNNEIYILQGNGTTNLWRYILNLNTYYSSGTFTSAVINIGHTVSSWGTIAWNSALTAGQSIVTYVQSANNSGMTSASGWCQVTNGGASSGCLRSGDQYFQYMAVLFNGANSYVTPALNDLTLNYSGYSLVMIISKTIAFVFGALKAFL